MYLSSTFLNPDSMLGTVDLRGPFYPSLAEQLSLVVPSSEAAKCCSEAQTVLLEQTKYEVFFNPALAVHCILSLDIARAYNTKHSFKDPVSTIMFSASGIGLVYMITRFLMFSNAYSKQCIRANYGSLTLGGMYVLQF